MNSGIVTFFSALWDNAKNFSDTRMMIHNSVLQILLLIFKLNFLGQGCISWKHTQVTFHKIKIKDMGSWHMSINLKTFIYVQNKAYVRTINIYLNYDMTFLKHDFQINK